MGERDRLGREHSQPVTTVAVRPGPAIRWRVETSLEGVVWFDFDSVDGVIR